MAKRKNYEAQGNKISEFRSSYPINTRELVVSKIEKPSTALKIGNQ